MDFFYQDFEHPPTHKTTEILYNPQIIQESVDVPSLFFFKEIFDSLGSETLNYQEDKEIFIEKSKIDRTLSAISELSEKIEFRPQSIYRVHSHSVFDQNIDLCLIPLDLKFKIGFTSFRQPYGEYYSASEHPDSPVEQSNQSNFLSFICLLSLKSPNYTRTFAARVDNNSYDYDIVNAYCEKNGEHAVSTHLISSPYPTSTKNLSANLKTSTGTFSFKNIAPLHLIQTLKSIIKRENFLTSTTLADGLNIFNWPLLNKISFRTNEILHLEISPYLEENDAPSPPIFEVSSPRTISLGTPIPVENVSITMGSLEVFDNILSSQTSDINLLNNSSLILNLSNPSSLPCKIQGQGNVIKKGPGSLRLCSELVFNGNIQVSEGELVLEPASIYYPKGFGAISVAKNGFLIFKGVISPKDSLFNPEGEGQVTFDGAEINDNKNSKVRTLTIGSLSQAIQIGPSGLKMNFDIGNKVYFDYQLNTQGPIIKEGSSGISLRGGAASTHNGSLLINEGWVDIDDKFTASQNTIINLGSKGTLNLYLAKDKNISYSVQGLPGAIWNKTGPGASIMSTKNRSSKALETYSGTINLKEGRLFLENLSLSDRAVVNISRGATLDLSGGTPESRLKCGSLTMQSQSTLRLIQENTESYVHLKQISATNGAVLAIQFRSSPNKTAPILLESLKRNPRSRINLQFRPIGPDLSLKDGAIYPLISRAGAESIDFSSFRLMPSIRFSPFYTLSRKGTEDTKSNFYANLIADNETLYVKINTHGFYSGLLRGSPTLTNPPSNAFLYTYLLDQIHLDQVPLYSAFDQFITSNAFYGTDWNAITPISTQNLNHSLLSGDLELYAPEKNAFRSMHMDMIMHQALEKSTSSQNFMKKHLDTLSYCSSIENEFLLKTDRNWKGWSQSQNQVSVSQNDLYRHNINTKITGVAYQLSQSQMLGYQHIHSKIDYQAKDDNHYGHIQSKLYQAIQKTLSHKFHSTMIWTYGEHDIHGERVIEAPIEETAQRWIAHSNYEVKEFRCENDLSLKTTVSSNVEFNWGLHSVFSHFSQSAYMETKADDLNLKVSAQNQNTVIYGPKIEGQYYYETKHSWALSVLQIRCDYHPPQKIQTQFGLTHYESSVILPISYDGYREYILSFDHVLGTQDGLCLKAQLNCAHNGTSLCRSQATLSIFSTF